MKRKTFDELSEESCKRNSDVPFDLETARELCDTPFTLVDPKYYNAQFFWHYGANELRLILNNDVYDMDTMQHYDIEEYIANACTLFPKTLLEIERLQKELANAYKECYERG